MARTGFHLAGDLIWVHGQRDGTSAQHRPRGTTGIHPWRLLGGTDLDSYLGDARSLRNRLAHVGTTDGAGLRSPFSVMNGKSAVPQMTLMLAEGLLQAAQDIAYLALNATGPAAAPVTGGWEWVQPRPSATSRMQAWVRRHAAFPLP